MQILYILYTQNNVNKNNTYSVHTTVGLVRRACSCSIIPAHGVAAGLTHTISVRHILIAMIWTWITTGIIHEMACVAH